ncbi:RNase E inhibitor protein [compost metagenome]
MTEDWNLFERNKNNEHSVIFMNLALKLEAPLAGYTKLITFVFNMYSLWDKAGSTSKSAQQLFYSLEDKLMERMKDTQAVYVGRISVDNKMELYFYGQPSVEWDSQLKSISADFPDFRYYYHINNDEEWTFYHTDMLPTPMEEQWMRNAKIAYALKQHGDDSETVRDVEHWLHFPSKSSMDEVKNKVELLGYRITNADLDSTKTTNPYVLQVSKQHALELNTVNEVTRELFVLASEVNGTYDGWGTRLKLKFPTRVRFAFIKIKKKISSPWVIAAIISILIAVVLLMWWLY